MRATAWRLSLAHDTKPITRSMLTCALIHIPLGGLTFSVAHQAGGSGASGGEILGAILFVGLVWFFAKSASAQDAAQEEQMKKKLQSAIDWLAEKKKFRALQADPQVWEDWLDRGQKLAVSLVEGGSQNKERIAKLEQMRDKVVNDLRVYESARAIVAMQSGSNASERQSGELPYADSSDSPDAKK